MQQAATRQINYSELGARAQDPVIVQLMKTALSRPDMLSLAAGFTDNSVLPADLVRREVERLTNQSESPEYLQYGINPGRPGLREQVTRFLATYPGEETLDIDPEQVIITNGSQQALYLCIQVLCDPGDIVLVERPSYFVFLEMLNSFGVEAVSMPTKDDGRIDFEGLSEMLAGFEKSGRRERLKAIYLIGYFANPSSRCVPEADKQQLGILLQELDYTLPVIEDAAYRELYYKSPYPAKSILSLPEFDGLPKLYTGTFTKPFATGMKVGYACCTDSSWLKKLLNVKGHHDFGTSNFNQAIIESVLQHGLYPEFLEGLRIHYGKKMKLLENVIRDGGLPSSGWAWDSPLGGLLLWLRGPMDIDTGIGSSLYEACLKQNVIYVPGDLCFAGEVPLNYVRLSIGALAEELLEEAARRFAAAVLSV